MSTKKKEQKDKKILPIILGVALAVSLCGNGYTFVQLSAVDKSVANIRSQLTLDKQKIEECTASLSEISQKNEQLEQSITDVSEKLDGLSN